jgi:hypothetical protein
MKKTGFLNNGSEFLEKMNPVGFLVFVDLNCNSLSFSCLIQEQNGRESGRESVPKSYSICQVVER